MDINIQKINSKNVDLMAEFFQNCNTSDRYREESFEGILEQISLDNTFNVYGNVVEGKITSAIMMMDLPMQKVQILDLYLTRKGLDLNQSRLGDVVGYAIEQGESRGIYRVMSMVTETYYKKLRKLERANKVFTWKKRYDCVVDEILEPNFFSNYGVIYNYITKQALRKDRIVITHYHLKPEHRYETCQTN